MKVSSFDVTGLLTPGTQGVLTLTIDGSALFDPVDLFSIDYVELTASGIFCPASEDADGDRKLHDLRHSVTIFSSVAEKQEKPRARSSCFGILCLEVRQPVASKLCNAC